VFNTTCNAGAISQETKENKLREDMISKKNKKTKEYIVLTIN
jgi:hypothetical protein